MTSTRTRTTSALMLMLPYKGNGVMMIVLPDEGKMKEVEALICKDHLRHWHENLFRR